MPVPIFDLGVAAWSKSHPQLCAMGQVMPPNNVQILVYYQINQNEIERMKKKYYSRLEAIHHAYTPGKAKQVTIRRKDENGQRTQVYRGSIYTTQRWNQMRMHRDNGRMNCDTGVIQFANHDNQMNSHIFGTDVMTCTRGDSMNFDLVTHLPTQDITISSKQARANIQHIQKQKGDLRAIIKSVDLDNGSIYLHTSHDDEMYFHRAMFPKATSDQNKIRLAFVFRWLCVPTYYRQNSMDEGCNRYSMVNKHAFEKIESLGKSTEHWWEALGYGKGRPILDLMDPI